MDLRDGAKLRKLAAQYRAQGFKDVDKLGEGYELVANCLEHPGEASRAAAQVVLRPRARLDPAAPPPPPLPRVAV